MEWLLRKVVQQQGTFMASIYLAVKEIHTRLSISIILRKAGFRSIDVPEQILSKKQITDIENSEDPVIVVFDVLFPGYTELKILESYQKHSQQARFLIISSVLNTEMQSKLCSIGFSEHLEKPFDPEELVQRVRSLLMSG